MIQASISQHAQTVGSLHSTIAWKRLDCKEVHYRNRLRKRTAQENVPWFPALMVDVTLALQGVPGAHGRLQGQGELPGAAVAWPALHRMAAADHVLGGAPLAEPGDSPHPGPGR